MSRILVVDDEPNVLSSLQKMLAKDGYDVTTAHSGAQGLELVDHAAPDVVLMDVRMGDGSGLEALAQLRRQTTKLPVIMMTAFGTTDTAIEAMKRGAFDYVMKPFDIPKLKALVARAVEASRLMRNPVTYGASQPAPAGERIIGQSPSMVEVYKLIGQVAASDAVVLIRGESGTGKELVARAIYHHSRRADAPFLALNCAAIPETLLEAELFGYERGAFTGALAAHPGKFEQAHQGTLFLDEIADMSPSIQAKVLRVLQDRRFERLGSRHTVQADVRVLAATNKDLETMVRQQRFREDLYYRLNVVVISLPPLRARKDDVPLLARYFLARYAQQFGRIGIELTDGALRELAAYGWPGNVRELENCIQHAVLTAGGSVILPEHLPLGAHRVASSDTAQALRDAARQALERSPGAAYHQAIEQVERHVIEEALKQTQGNLVQSAKLLGITRVTLRDKMARLGIQRAFRVASEVE